MLVCVKENGLEGPKKSYTNKKQEYQLIPVLSVKASPVQDKRLLVGFTTILNVTGV